MEIKSAEFVKSAAKLSQLPEIELPEFAFIGRSNVGKSSLINALCMRKKLVKVSKRPGTTQLLNYFIINQNFYFVDLPGYGYARVSLEEKKSWSDLIQKYLLDSKNLLHIYVLVDCRHGIGKLDQLMIDFLRQTGRNYSILATKRDKLTRNEWNKNQKLFKTQLFNNDVISVSVMNKNGLDDVYKDINAKLKGALNEKHD